MALERRTNPTFASYRRTPAYAACGSPLKNVSAVTETFAGSQSQ
jgi:hypothetical protein